MRSSGKVIGHIFSVFFFFVISILACKQPLSNSNELGTSTAVKNRPGEIIELEEIPIDSSDFDSYFTSTKTISSPYGPKHITRTILQDSKGTIWLATWEGIQSYDGKTFTNHTNKEGLRRWRAFSIMEDRDGNVWFAMVGAGVYKYDGKTFTNYDSSDGLVNDRVTNLYQDKKGDIWIGSEKGLSRFDGKSFENFTAENGLHDIDINGVIEDDNGRYWIATRGYTNIYDGKSFSVLEREDGQGFGNTRCIIKDRNGNMWLGGNDGLWKYDGESFLQYTDTFVGRIYEDRAGNIWTSSVSAKHHYWQLSRYNAAQLKTNEVFEPEVIREGGRMYFGITEDDEGGIWLGSLDGACRFQDEDANCFWHP